MDQSNNILNIHSETKIIKKHIDSNTLDKYKFPNNIVIGEIIKLLFNIIQLISQGNIIIENDMNSNIVTCHKNYKMNYYNSTCQFIVDTVLLYYNDANKYILNEFINDRLLRILTIQFKGHLFLNKINQYIYLDDTDIDQQLIYASINGMLPTFLFWYDKLKNIEIYNKNYMEYFENSVGNSDDRIFKYLLKNKSSDTEFNIANIMNKLVSSLVPTKYILRRIKLLSTYIDLSDHFETMIITFTDTKIINEIHKYYYKTYQYNINSMQQLLLNIYYKMSQVEILTNIRQILKSEEEQIIFDILYTLKLDSLPENYNMVKITNYKLFENIVISNYDSIISNISWKKFVLLLDYTINKNILQILTRYNLIAKYINDDIYNILKIDINMLLHTKYLTLNNNIIESKYNTNTLLSYTNKVLSMNKILYYIRIFMRKRYNNKIINHKIKTFNLIKEIKTFVPNEKIKILNRGSLLYQYDKQKFTTLPPRHLLPKELSSYNNFLLREKADGILVNNLPNDIYPHNDIITSHNIKAEYIEDLDLFLIFDIDIPNTMIKERYEILRNAHPYTKNTKLQYCETLDDFYKIMDEERLNINNFINNNTNSMIKWYPKFAVEVYNNFYKNIICDVIISGNNRLLKNNIYNCDGLILTPLVTDLSMREIKIKPLSHCSIDLLYSNKLWLDSNNNDWSHIIIPTDINLKDNKIYRCYPNMLNLQFTVDSMRYDKKRPNSFSIIDNIINILKYDWTNDSIVEPSYYYDNVKKSIIDNKLVTVLNNQSNIFNSTLLKIRPNCNKNWLDLGCGSGKYINNIKKYMPKNYMGIDIDIKQLIKALSFNDMNQDIYKFIPCDLSKDWSDYYIKWASINMMIKYDYIIANFSLMHFCNDMFWSQLDKLVSQGTQFMFNIVALNNNHNMWKYSDSYLNIDTNINETKYKFMWSHNIEKTESFISTDTIKGYLMKYDWMIVDTIQSDSIELDGFYQWYIVKKR